MGLSTSVGDIRNFLSGDSNTSTRALVFKDWIVCSSEEEVRWSDFQSDGCG
jgi:hypothetical protein